MTALLLGSLAFLLVMGWSFLAMAALQQGPELDCRQHQPEP